MKLAKALLLRLHQKLWINNTMIQLFNKKRKLCWKLLSCWSISVDNVRYTYGSKPKLEGKELYVTGTVEYTLYLVDKFSLLRQWNDKYVSINRLVTSATISHDLWQKDDVSRNYVGKQKRHSKTTRWNEGDMLFTSYVAKKKLDWTSFYCYAQCMMKWGSVVKH